MASGTVDSLVFVFLDQLPTTQDCVMAIASYSSSYGSQKQKIIHPGDDLTIHLSEVLKCYMKSLFPKEAKSKSCPVLNFCGIYFDFNKL